MNIFEDEIRYPRIGDKFFIEEGSSNEIAWLQKTFQDFGSYADSYQTGALNLIDNALEKQELRDYLIYPAVFFNTTLPRIKIERINTRIKLL
jgi:hypothetical protein